MSVTYNTWLSLDCRRGQNHFGTILILIDYIHKSKRLHLYILCCMSILLLNIKKKTKNERREREGKKTIIVYKIDKITLFFVHKIIKEHDSIFDFFFLFIFVFFFVFQNKHHLVSHFFTYTPVYVCQRTISHLLLVIINFFSFFSSFSLVFLYTS